MKNIVLRADGSSTIGMGHVMRCLAFFEMLKDRANFSFVMFSPDSAVRSLISGYNIPIIELENQTETGYVKKADALVLDGYWYDNEYIRKVKEATKVIQIDDYAGTEFFSDIVINHALGADYGKSVFRNKCLLLSGSNYALLRNEFLTAAQEKRVFFDSGFVTISMGGADPSNYTLKLIKALVPGEFVFKKINVIVGPLNSNESTLRSWMQNNPEVAVEIHKGLDATQMVALLKQTGLLICPASTTVYEAAAAKVPVACFISAANQEGIYKGLLESGSVEAMGALEDMSDETLKAKLKQAFIRYDELVEKAKRHEKLIDGKSANRIKEAVLSLWN